MLIWTVLATGIFTTDAYCQSHRVLRHNWSIVADGEQAVLTIEYKDLGIVAKNVRLNLKRGDKLQLLSNWKVKKTPNAIIINTVAPDTTWQFSIKNNLLNVTCSSDDGVITAVAPADKDRIPARIIETDGKPAAWSGTREVTFAYGGPQTHNLSFLPKQNPEVLYLSIGQVSGSNIHCLFDRKTDTAIEFSKKTLMLRSDEDQDIMVVTMMLRSDEDQDMMVAMPPNSAAIRITRDYYTKKLGLPVYKPFDDSYFDKAPVVWNSWTNYYYKVTEDDIVKNVEWIVDNLKEYGLKYVTLDDGYDRGKKREHYWIDNWDKKKFPHGGKWLAQYIRSKGLLPGLWLVPNVYAGAVEEHPQWYLRDKDGELIISYNTPTLDCTNPEVLDFLTHLFTTLKDWGFEYYKFDAEFAMTEYIPSVDRERLYDKSISPLDAYRNRLEVIRRATGKKTCIEGCPSGTPLHGIGYFDSYFNGDDIYNSWLGMYPFFASINANVFLNHIVCYLMPGEGICVSPKVGLEEAKAVFNPEFIRVAATRESNLTTLGTTLGEARTIATFSALSGTACSFADMLFKLPEERVQLLKKTLPTMPIVPIDLFSRGGYMHWNLWKEFTPEQYVHDFPGIMDLKINAISGIYDVVSVTNWSEEKTSRSVSFEGKLGLNPDKSYVVFDFWNQKLEGIFKDSLEVFIEPHDTHVFIIRPVLGRPQLLATSRHITGAFSIKDLAWNPSAYSLRGSSQTVPDEPYSLFVYMPEGVTISKTNANADILFQKNTNGLLEVAFQGQKELVDWAFDFSLEGESR